MNTVRCPGCQKSFNQGKGIKLHQRNCAALYVVAREQFRKRDENVQKREAAKLARLDGQTIDDVAEECQELRDELDGDIILDYSVPEVIDEPSLVRVKKGEL